MKPPHKTIAQLTAIIERLEKWQDENAKWLDQPWRLNYALGELISILRELENRRQAK